MHTRKWKTASKPDILQDNEAHIWHIDIKKTDHELECYHNLLSINEKEQANRFYFDRDRIRHIITHGVLRLLISGYLGIKHNDIYYNYNKYRKPELPTVANKKLCFNLSHSGTYIVYAFSWNRELGIDIEKIKTIKDADSIVGRFYSEHENNDYFSLPDTVRSKAFFNCWTRKEAYIKARGDGLHFPLNRFSISINPDDPPVLIDVKDEPLEKDRWHFHEFKVNDEYCSVIAIEDKKIVFRYFQWLK